MSLSERVENGEASILLCLRSTVSTVNFHQVAVLDAIVILQVLKGLPVDIQSFNIHYPAIFARSLLQLLKDRQRGVLDRLISVLIIAKSELSSVNIQVYCGFELKSELIQALAVLFTQSNASSEGLSFSLSEIVREVSVQINV